MKHIKTHEIINVKGSAFSKYKQLVVGSSSTFRFLYYEWCQLLSVVPGALGIALRRIFWPSLLGSCGKDPVFGVNVILRHPGRIHLGSSVVISEGCILDARSFDEKQAIVLEDNVILSSNVMLSCKDGTITIGKHSGVNVQTIIQSTNWCPVQIGSDVIIGQRCFIVGGGNYNIDNIDVPMRTQGIKDDGGVIIHDDVWLGGNATVLGGVEIGKGTVVAASSVMTKSVPAFSVCKGIPAQITGSRNSK